MINFRGIPVGWCYTADRRFEPLRITFNQADERPYWYQVNHLAATVKIAADPRDLKDRLN